MEANNEWLQARNFRDHSTSSYRPLLEPTTSPHNAVLQRPTADAAVQADPPSLMYRTGTRGQNLPTLPTPSQQLAILVVQRHTPLEVVAWLKLIRSLEPSYRHRHGPNNLSRRELDALSELKECPNELIVNWLMGCHRSGDLYGLPTPYVFGPTSPSPASAQAVLNTPKPAILSSTDPSALFSVSSHSADDRKLLTPLNRDAASTKLTIRSSSDGGVSLPAKAKGFPRWCVICNKPFETGDGWKRHMREHETTYICMPNGPVRISQTGQICYFCGTISPDEHHLATAHDVAQCRGKRCGYTRKVNLINHLKKSHGAQDAIGLAEEWEDMNKNGKKFFSCGFCITYFTRITAQLSHIDGQHWSRRQPLSDWSWDKVILGLLSRPKMREAWRSTLAQHQLPVDAELDFHWDASVVADLQITLEQGNQSVDALAQVAFTRTIEYRSRTFEVALRGNSERIKAGMVMGEVSLIPRRSYDFPHTANGRPASLPPTHPGASHLVGTQKDHPTGPTSKANDPVLQRLHARPAGASDVQYCPIQQRPTMAQSLNWLAFGPWSSRNGVTYPRETNVPPWSSYAPLEPQINNAYSQSPLSPNVMDPAALDFDYSSTATTTSDHESGFQAGAQLFQDNMFGTLPLETSPSSISENPLPLDPREGFGTKPSPTLTIGPKRKLSLSRLEQDGNEDDLRPVIKVNTERRSRQMFFDDHLRRKRRMES